MPGSGEGVGALTGCLVQGSRAFANTLNCCAAGTSSFAGLCLAKGCPAPCCLGVAALLILNSRLSLAALQFGD